MSNQTSRSARFRYTATGALAALVAAGAIAGTVALGDSPPAAKTPGRATVPKGPSKSGAPQSGATPQPFLDAIQRLVKDGTVTGAEGQAVEREVVTGRIDTETLASDGLTPAQLEAVQEALANTKRALAPTAPRAPK